MKKYLAARMRLSAILMAGALGTTTFVAHQTLNAQSTPDKIRLMAETLRARDSGNLETAKAKAEELIKIAPNDENVQRLLASINAEMDRRSGGQAVYGVAPNITKEAAMSMDSSASGAEAITAAAAASQDANLAAAKNAITEAEELAALGAYADATNLLNAASASLTLNTATADTIDALEDAKAQVVLEEAKALADAGDLKGAEQRVEDYRSAGGNSRKANSLANKLDDQISNPYDLDINDVSPEYVAQSKIIRDLLTQGRAQYLNGDYDGASASFRQVEARDSNNAEAKLFQTKIAEILGGIHKQNFYKTRQQMLTEVDQNWERPKVFDITSSGPVDGPDDSVIARKMNNIVIPQVNFSGMELTRVIETLSELSVEYDVERTGVNIVPLFNPNDTNPRVNISLRNLSLDRILQFVTQQVNFEYDVGADAVTVAPSGGESGSQGTITEFFPISRATVIRLTGFRDGGGSSAGPVDPFAAPSSGGSSGPSQNEEVEALQNFFQSAGVNFEIPGSSLAFDGEQLIVTQSRRNLERMRTILRNYNEVKQVEIEAKFLEVSQNDLEEVGFDWNVGDSPTPFLTAGGAPILDDFGNPTVAYERVGQTQQRTLNDGFSVSTAQSNITINGGAVASNSAPDLASAIDLASNATSLFTASGWSVNGYDVNFALRALSRKSGSDLMSAPKVTVLSGKRANITVAQELRYPESYGDIESTVSSSNSGGAAISITAGTPQDFVTRNVGVEMSVTPNVENDDTISLILEPRVTEFEGFVEYGGPSVAVVGGGTSALAGVVSEPTTVTVPAGFYQPVFSTRELSTEVTVFDGATVVMGGLTRDEVKTINDKVPVLGDIPGLGRLFRSEGETRQKRNLLIFVTANLVSPGGSPSRQQYRNVNANSLFQNPTIMTPAGAANRSIDAAE
ncbi:MAG TPA: type II secretory pathway, component PulD [Opitutae bacterium]|nr:type II secretory pathway, component PulD [Opitutae bacterium]